MATQQIPVIEQTITIDQTKVVEFQEQAPVLLKQARDFTIEDATDYEFSLTIAEESIKRQKAIKEFFAPTKKLAHQLHGNICDMENALLRPYAEVENLMKNRRLNFRQLEEQKRLSAEAEARKKAQAEQQKQAVEQAAQLEKEGEKEAAEVVLQAAMDAPAPAVVVPSSVPRQTGSAVRGEWDYRVDNPDQVQREYCDPSDKKIRAIVKSLGKSAPIKGITVFWKETEAIRTKGR